MNIGEKSRLLHYKNIIMAIEALYQNGEITADNEVYRSILNDFKIDMSAPPPLLSEVMKRRLEEKIDEWIEDLR